MQELTAARGPPDSSSSSCYNIGPMSPGQSEQVLRMYYCKLNLASGTLYSEWSDMTGIAVAVAHVPFIMNIRPDSE